MSYLRGVKLEKKLTEIYNGLQLYKKKEDRFGFLDEEEIVQREDWLIEFRVLQEEIKDYSMDEHLFKLIHDTETRELDAAVKRMIPAWNGGFVLRLEEFEDILDISLTLTEDDLVELSENLVELHKKMMTNFSEFAAKKENEEHIRDLAVVASGREDGSIMDIVRYIDDRYREFGELFGIELFEIKVMFK